MPPGTDDPKAETSNSLANSIAEWRSYVRRRQAIHPVDADKLENHLRSQASALKEAGLAGRCIFPSRSGSPRVMPMAPAAGATTISA